MCGVVLFVEIVLYFVVVLIVGGLGWCKIVLIDGVVIVFGFLVFGVFGFIWLWIVNLFVLDMVFLVVVLKVSNLMENIDVFLSWFECVKYKIVDLVGEWVGVKMVLIVYVGIVY